MEVDSPVYIFLWRDGIGDKFAVNGVNGVQRQLDNEAVDRLVFINGQDALQDLQDNRTEEVSAAASLLVDTTITFITNLILRH